MDLNSRNFCYITNMSENNFVRNTYTILGKLDIKSDLILK